MTQHRVSVECDVHDSFRVQQISGLFDLPIEQRLQQVFEAELPDLSEDWRIGAIVGPSGSGKSTLARAAFGAALHETSTWPRDAAIIDSLGSAPIKQLTQMLTAVGLGSPPTWLKPHHVLSNGEKFRCELARALLNAGTSPDSLVVFDEFTSVVDRTVAKVASAAISRAIRQQRVTARFVAVTCHYDVLDWLEADWVLDLAAGKLARGRLRRPAIELQVNRCPQDTWRLFARHHYLSGGLSRGATCYLATWDGQPVAFCAVIAMLGRSGHKRISRIVTLPDYQGLGIGARLMERVCEHYVDLGQRIGVTASHPAIVAYCQRSSKWRLTNVRRTGNLGRQQVEGRRIKSSAGRSVASFEFCGERANER